MQDRHILVTGASSGIGEAIAAAFGRASGRVSLVARRQDRLSALKSKIETDGGQAAVFARDLSDPSGVDQVLADAEDAFGPVDVLINNAGVQIVEPIENTDPDDGERLLALNLLTPMRMMRAVVPGMLDRRSGSIVNIASVAAFAPLPGMAWYNASKAGLAAASEAVAGELRSRGVHVLTVYPGPVHTALGDGAADKMGRDWTTKIQQWGTAEELGSQVLKAVRRREGRLVYPKSYRAVRHIPGIARAAIDRFAPRP